MRLGLFNFQRGVAKPKLSCAHLAATRICAAQDKNRNKNVGGVALAQGHFNNRRIAGQFCNKGTADGCTLNRD